MRGTNGNDRRLFSAHPSPPTPLPPGARGGSKTESASNPYESSVPATPRGQIDELVFGQLRQLGIEPAHLCSDAVFVRRAYLDVIGTLPTGAEAWQFLQDRDPRQAPRT